MPLLTVDHVSIAFGHLPLLDDASMQIEAGERVAVIGRNGTGKSTLLQMVNGEVAPDTGSVWRQVGLRTARLDQDASLSDSRPVFDVVAEGLGSLSELVAAYHHAAVLVAEVGSPDDLEQLGRLHHELEERDGWRLEQRVEQVLAHLNLAADTSVDTLSGGWRRRVLMARALVSQPDLLLLDEPTNHLDIDAIAWLEAYLAEFQGAVLFVTHDRAFLQRLATRIVELDRGRLTSWPGDYTTFLRRKDEALAAEAGQQEKFDRKLAEEEAWLRQGIKARRTRNEGRVRALLRMREERAARRSLVGTVRLQVEHADPSGKVVFEAEEVTKGFGDRMVVNGFSARIVRGDRVGVVGANGVGKTTLLRLLLGELEPDRGELRTGANVQVAYYDQQREQLDPERTVFDTIGEGSEVVVVAGRPRHVNGYLRDFLFPPERARSPVKALSGGERNRLLLARLFTRPANVLVLDEPTNDLDLETLELLEAQLVEWPGTLILVSHDRIFLDNVVTSTLVFEGGGRIAEYVGGYEDYLRVSHAVSAAGEPAPESAGRRRESGQARANVATAEGGAPTRKRLSYMEQREFDALPARIEALEAEQQQLHAAVAARDFYKEAPDAIRQSLSRLDELQAALLSAYARWDDLDSRRSN